MKPQKSLDLANKYRPTSFSEVVGQDHVSKILENHIKTGSIPNSIILFGPSGCGKTTLARIFAKTLNQSEHGIFELDSAEDGGKDKIQALISSMYNAPLSGNYKTYIFDESQEITRQAFASLLKITEEPPPHVKFIFLTTDFEKIHPSIVTRSECHGLIRISNSSIKERLKEICELENKEVPDDILNLVTQSSNGSLRKALLKLEELFIVDPSTNTETVEEIVGVISSQKLTKFILSYISKDFKNLYSTSKMLKSDKADLTKVVFDLEQLIMDCRLSLFDESIIALSKSDLSYFSGYLSKNYSSSSPKDLKPLGNSLDKLYDLTLQFEGDLKRTSNKDALISRFLVKLVKSFSDDK